MTILLILGLLAWIWGIFYYAENHLSEREKRGYSDLENRKK